MGTGALQRYYASMLCDSPWSGEGLESSIPQKGGVQEKFDGTSLAAVMEGACASNPPKMKKRIEQQEKKISQSTSPK